MPGLSPKLPLNIDQVDGYSLNKTFKQLSRQNLKMVIMTNPGERIMIPDFGVGIKTYLFENATQATFDEIEDEIKDQVSKYLPYMIINSIQFNSEQVGINMSELETSSTSNYVNLQIKYSIPSSFISDELNLKI
jgi:hypothetical protein